MAKKQQEDISNEMVEENVEQQVVEQPEEPKVTKNESSKKGILFSRNNFASRYVYNGEECMITAKGKIKVDNVDLIKQPLSAGLLLRKIS